MPTVESIAEDILSREGGFVNDPDDTGGATNHGITIATMRGLGLDLTGDGVVSEADVRALTRAEARKILIDRYFNRPGLSTLPALLHESVFDMQVNAGAQAVRMLQALLGKMGFLVAIDGAVGPQTREAASLAAEAAPNHLADAYGIEWRNYYYALADRRPSSRKYARRRDGGKGGWIVRAEDFISPRFHLSDAEHAARVARRG